MFVALRKESVDRNMMYLLTASAFLMSLSARRAWIEICGGACGKLLALSSLSARRAWIEIAGTTGKSNRAIKVALRKESVDRNRPSKQCAEIAKVALRKESVDRNTRSFLPIILSTVALRKESVDRNPNPLKFCAIC